jgi:MFS family permease
MRARNASPQRITSWLAQVQPHWMSRDSRLIMDARGAMSAVDGLTQVILPIYLSLLGFSGFRLGLLFAAVTTTDAVFSTAIGLLSDRIGRKPFMVGMPLLTAAAGFVFAFSHGQPLIFIFAALGSFGWGTGAVADASGPYTPAEQAWIADRTLPLQRTPVFGRMAFAASLGSLTGLQLTHLLPVALHLGLSGADAYRPLFFVCGLLALAASLLALPIADPRGSTARVRRSPLNISRTTWPLVLKFSLANSVNGVAVGLFGPFVTYWFYRRYGAGPELIGFLFSMINVMSLLSNMSAGPVARRLGLVRSITLGWAFQVAILIPMVLAPTFWVAGGLYLVRMFVQRLGTPLRRSYLVAVSPPGERGSVSGLTGLPMSGAVAAAPLFAGYLFEHAALAVPFEIGAVFQGIGCAIFWAFFRDTRPPEELPDSEAPTVTPAPAGT